MHPSSIAKDSQPPFAVNACTTLKVLARVTTPVPPPLWFCVNEEEGEDVARGKGGLENSCRCVSDMSLSRAVSGAVDGEEIRCGRSGSERANTACRRVRVCLRPVGLVLAIEGARRYVGDESYISRLAKQVDATPTTIFPTPTPYALIVLVFILV